jgi:hypothetical protein
MKYRVYKESDDKTDLIAEVDGERITGSKAEMVEKILRDAGWPQERPDRVLHGMYIWAEKVIE